MRVAVFGSWRPGNSLQGVRGSREAFEDACRALGKGLAERGHTAIVASESPQTADRHVVTGMLEALHAPAPARPSIEVVHAPQAEIPFVAESTEHADCFFSSRAPERVLVAVHMHMIQKADAVLTVGGSTGTYVAGIAAIIGNRLVIPVASFGGASELMLPLVQDAAREEYHTHYGRLGNPWSEHVLNVAMDLLEVASRPRVLLIHGRSTDWQEVSAWLEQEALVKEVRVMKQEFGEGLTLPEKFEELARVVDRAVAIATPDDVGGPREQAKQSLRPRARQNVWLEIGWFWGALERSRIIILCRDAEDEEEIEIPSDLAGIETYHYAKSPLELEDKLRTFIRGTRRD